MTTDTLSRLVTREDRLAMFEAYLETRSFSEVARQCGRDRETVAKYINTQEFKEFEDATVEAAKAVAKSVMARKTSERLKEWETASGIAADKGDHKPAKEWLESSGAIERGESTSNHNTAVSISFGSMPNRPQANYLNPFEMDTLEDGSIVPRQTAVQPQILDGSAVSAIKGQIFDTEVDGCGTPGLGEDGALDSLSPL